MGIRHLFIINPAAGQKDNSKLIIDRIYANNLHDGYAIEVTKYPGHAKEIASKYASISEDELRIYACGGDGTLAEVVNGAFGYEHCAIAPIPIGSGNDFIKNFDEYSKLDFLRLENMIYGKTHIIDSIVAGDEVSINIVSAGYDAAVAKKMQDYKKLPVVGGGFAYKLSCVNCLVNKVKHRFKVISDGVEIDSDIIDNLLIIAANGKYYGGGFKAAPLADLQDGYIDLIRVPTISRLFFIKFVSLFKKGEHLQKIDIIRFSRCKKLQLIADDEIDINIDGEIVPMKNPLIELREKSVKIILPRKSR